MIPVPDPTRPAGPDWQRVRDRLDPARVATDLLGPPPGRKGDRSRNLWWSCPFHEDRNPSLAVDPARGRWYCFGCRAGGDLMDLVRRVRDCSFPEALAYLAGGPGGPVARPAPPGRAQAPSPPPGPHGGPPGALPGPPAPESTPGQVADLVARAVDRLWTAAGAAALADLRGRGLRDEAIRAARLGYGSFRLAYDSGKSWRPRGLTIPWSLGGRPTLIKVRQPAGRLPKYAEIFRDKGRHLGLYPGPEAVLPGRPLVVCEGEFDCLLLRQELGDLAGVVTLGSASNRPEAAVLDRLVFAGRMYLAYDDDEAGDAAADRVAAAGWPTPHPRARPPVGKDWVEAHQAGVDLRRWWAERLAGAESPAAYPERRRWA